MSRGLEPFTAEAQVKTSVYLDGFITMSRIGKDCLTILDGGFADGNGLQFKLGLNGLMDFCADSVGNGDCQRWWKEGARSPLHLWQNKIATEKVSFVPAESSLNGSVQILCRLFLGQKHHGSSI